MRVDALAASFAAEVEDICGGGSESASHWEVQHDCKVRIKELLDRCIVHFVERGAEFEAASAGTLALVLELMAAVGDDSSVAPLERLRSVVTDQYTVWLLDETTERVRERLAGVSYFLPSDALVLMLAESVSRDSPGKWQWPFLFTRRLDVTPNHRPASGQEPFDLRRGRESISIRMARAVGTVAREAACHAEKKRMIGAHGKWETDFEAALMADLGLREAGGPRHDLSALFAEYVVWLSSLSGHHHVRSWGAVALSDAGDVIVSAITAE